MWEGWLPEAVRFGGVRAERAEVWRWAVGGLPPGEEETFEEDLGAVKRAKEEERVRLAERAREAARLDGLEGDEEVATQRRTKTAKATREHDQALEALLAGYSQAPSEPVASTSALINTHATDYAPHIPPRLQPAPLTGCTSGSLSFSAADARRKLGDAPEPAAAPGRARDKGSILRAIKSIKEGRTERPDATVGGGFRSRAGAAGASIDNPKSGLELEEDPTIFEGVVGGQGGGEAEVAESEEEDEPIFEGLRFAVMGMSPLGEQVAAGIRRLQGIVSVDDERAEAQADWVVVPHFKQVQPGSL